MNIWQKYPKIGRVTLINPLWYVGWYVRNPLQRLWWDIETIYFDKPSFYCDEDMERIGVPVAHVKGWDTDTIALWLLSHCSDFNYELEELSENIGKKLTEKDWITKYEQYKDSMVQEEWTISFEDNNYLKKPRKILCWKINTFV